MKDRLLLLDPLLVAILLQLLVPEVALQADYLLVLLLQDLDQLTCNQFMIYCFFSIESTFVTFFLFEATQSKLLLTLQKMSQKVPQKV